VTKELPFAVYLTSCSALSSDHLPVRIETVCRSSFHQPPYRPNFRRTDSANLKNTLARSNSDRSGIAQWDGNRHMR
jgi:hypothetical protein